MSAVSLAIVGAGPAGLAAARAFREADGTGRVALIAGEQVHPYRRPPLTKELLRGEQDPAELPLTEDAELAELGVERIDGLAVALDPGEKALDLADGRRLAFDHCILATGAEPRRLDIPGADLPRVRVVRSLASVQGLIEDLRPDARVAVVGSGFIGSEIAASLRMRGHGVTQLSTDPNPLQGVLGPQVAERIARWLTADGVDLRTQATVERIEADRDRLRVTAEAGVEVIADVVVMATGVAPRTELARAAGLDVSAAGVRADATLRTGHHDVLVCGDAAHADHALAGRPLHVEHWGSALEQGELAGTVAAGRDAVWDSVPGFWSTIGTHQLKYAAWGDGFDRVELTDHDAPDSFTARFLDQDGRLVGVLASERDEDYEAGREQIAAAARAQRAPA